MKSKLLKKKSSKDYYVEPNEMWGEIEEFYDRHKDSDDPDNEKMSDKLGKMIDDIATKLGFMMKFINYSYKDEMIGDARLKMVKAVYDQNFTLWKTSPCTHIRIEGERPYVISFIVNKHDWDDKKTYLKEWDTVVSSHVPVMVDDPEWIKPPCSKETPCSGKCKCDVEIPQVNVPEYLEYDNDNYIKFTTNFINHTVTVRNNPFAYFTKIAYHAFVNRIKKEKKVGDVLHAYQEKIYEDAYSSGNGWENVKRQKSEDEDGYFDTDEDIDLYIEENETCISESDEVS